MATSTRINAFLTDAVNKHPEGFTMDVNTGEVITHGMAVGGYHQEPIRNNYAYPTSPNWLRWENNGAGFVVPFEVVQEQIETWLEVIQEAGYIGGWVKDNVLTLDIVQVYPCISHVDGIADATPFLEASRLDQEAIGWLCPQFEHGYKEVGVNF